MHTTIVGGGWPAGNSHSRIRSRMYFQCNKNSQFKCGGFVAHMNDERKKWKSQEGEEGEEVSIAHQMVCKSLFLSFFIAQFVFVRRTHFLIAFHSRTRTKWNEMHIRQCPSEWTRSHYHRLNEQWTIAEGLRPRHQRRHPIESIFHFWNHLCALSSRCIYLLRVVHCN